MNSPIRILIADSDPNYSERLRDFLSRQVDLRVIDIVRDGPGIVKRCKEELPDLVLIDLHLPVLDSIKAVHLILTQNDRIKILGLTAIPHDRYMIEAIKVGASGCIEKNGHDSFGEIVTAIHALKNGEVFLNPNVALSILQEFNILS